MRLKILLIEAINQFVIAGLPFIILLREYIFSFTFLDRVFVVVLANLNNSHLLIMMLFFF